MSGGVSGVSVTNSRFINCATGIRVKSGRDRGGYVRDIAYRDIEIVGAISAAIMINAFYGGAPEGCPVVQRYPPPTIANVSFTNIKGLDTTGNLLQLSGLHDDPTYNISFVNVSFTGGGSTPPFSCMGGVKGTYQQLTPAPPSSCGLVPLKEW